MAIHLHSTRASKGTRAITVHPRASTAIHWLYSTPDHRNRRRKRECSTSHGASNGYFPVQPVWGSRIRSSRSERHAREALAGRRSHRAREDGVVVVVGGRGLAHLLVLAGEARGAAQIEPEHELEQVREGGRRREKAGEGGRSHLRRLNPSTSSSSTRLASAAASGTA